MDEQVEVTRIPLDIESLSKGDVITQETLIKIVGHPVGTPAYEFGLLGLREKIMDEKEVLGDPVTVRVSKGNIEVLTDELSSQYNNKRFKSHIGKMLTTHGRMMQVDESNLDEPDLNRHRKRIKRNGLTIQGALMGRSGKLQIEPYKTKTQLPAADAE